MIKRNLVIIFTLMMLVSSGPSLTQETSISPGINRHYQGALHSDWLPIFESESREVFAHRYEILDALNIKPGMRIADVGAGTGFYSLLFAKQTGPEGKVYAVDITEDFIDNINQRSSTAGINNLTGIVNNDKSAGLKKNSVDLIFICNTYHHFEYPESMMTSIHQALTDDGEVVLIDFSKNPSFSSAWIMGHVRANQQQVIDEMKSFGFTVSKTLPLLKQNYFIKFKKTKN